MCVCVCNSDGLSGVCHMLACWKMPLLLTIKQAPEGQRVDILLQLFHPFPLGITLSLMNSSWCPCRDGPKSWKGNLQKIKALQACPGPLNFFGHRVPIDLSKKTKVKRTVQFQGMHILNVHTATHQCQRTFSRDELEMTRSETIFFSGQSWFRFQ